MFGCMLCLLVTAHGYDWGGSVLIIHREEIVLTMRGKVGEEGE